MIPFLLICWNMCHYYIYQFIFMYLSITERVGTFCFDYCDVSWNRYGNMFHTLSLFPSNIPRSGMTSSDCRPIFSSPYDLQHSSPYWWAASTFHWDCYYFFLHIDFVLFNFAELPFWFSKFWGEVFRLFLTQNHVTSKQWHFVLLLSINCFFFFKNCTFWHFQKYIVEEWWKPASLSQPRSEGKCFLFFPTQWHRPGVVQMLRFWSVFLLYLFDGSFFIIKGYFL